MNLLDQLSKNADSNDTPIGRKSTVELFDALELLIADINGFLRVFCEKLQREALEHECPRGHLHDTDELFEEHEDWDVKRVHVEQKIREQVDLLEDAWLRLESEQRSLLQMKEGLAVGLANRGEMSTATVSRGTVLPSVHDVSKTSAQSQLAAVHEFEKLRQEIQAIRPQYTVKRD